MENALSSLEIIHLGLMEYSTALEIQKKIVSQRVAGLVPDRLLLVEHPAVITIGRSGSEEDLIVPVDLLIQKNIAQHQCDRGGKTTFHNPGQLVAYPIIELVKKDLHWYVSTLLEVVAALLREYGLSPVFKKESPGIWIKDKKIASIGMATKKWVTYHGIALNVNNDLAGFNCIIPCGIPNQQFTSMEQELGAPLDLSRIKKQFVHHFKKLFFYQESYGQKHPSWLTVPCLATGSYRKMASFLEELDLSTVCQSAHCPNVGECFGKGTATFMILGRRCTRSCRFCAVDKGVPSPVDPLEPERVAEAVHKLGLRYAVITSVSRDDLSNGGADHFANTVLAIRRRCPATLIEILVPDFKGIQDAIETVCTANPDMFNHNIETVSRLYPEIRPQAIYDRSLNVLAMAASKGLAVKSGLMLGLGEMKGEVISTLKDLRRAGCAHLTLGQYLAPSKSHHAVSRYVPPDEFEEWRKIAKSIGFKEVAAGPLVRSSYRAEEFYTQSVQKKTPITETAH